MGGDEAHQNMQPSLALNFTQRTVGTFPSRSGASSGNEMLGQVGITAKSFLASDEVLADGELLPISQNTALFSLLGTIYGGDGRSTFALPDFRGRSAIGEGAGADLTPRVLGETGGQEAVSLTPAELPSMRTLQQRMTPLLSVKGRATKTCNLFSNQLYGCPPRSFPNRSVGSAQNLSDPYLGEISMFSGNFIPSGWAPADGQLLPISQHQALFSVRAPSMEGMAELRLRYPICGDGLLCTMALDQVCCPGA